MSILVVLAHPNLSTQSRVNKALKVALEPMGVTISDLYALYPDFKIDIASEQDKLIKAKSLVFQFPMFWYSCPALLKQYFDDVLTYGFAYGSKGKALADKTFALAISLGAREGDFQGKFSLESVLTPFRAISHFIGTKYAAPFLTYDTGNLSDTALQAQARGYQEWVKGLA
ncbi:NAD(P)H-dependent oxidoreductase [Helicobacter ailurogastricus]|uniref:NAD(P)H-dependent oxidoreductase n=1 Tax=Helicobacter ailurogastricus TaxID=1578720 RepID=UPI00244D8A82|nr:NAD(P)H-dependent oxidoreductase [Helicobacter ailurogastricus]GMB91722.1 NAD(P)H-dependent oxidoreductase [Helicobacter ailurogastricus]